MNTIRAFGLGFSDRLRGSGLFGRTWDDDQDLNEAYDRGMNFAEALFDL